MLHHDSRHLMYRTPAGPGACGAPVTLRLKAHPPVEKVTLRLWWQDAEKLLPMQHAGDGLWTVDFTLPDTPGTLWYLSLIHILNKPSCHSLCWSSSTLLFCMPLDSTGYWAAWVWALNSAALVSASSSPVRERCV